MSLTPYPETRLSPKTRIFVGAASAGPVREWLREAADGFERERLYLVRLTSAVGPLPSTPGAAQSESALVALRHAIETLAKSPATEKRTGTRISFLPDAQIFPDTEFRYETLENRLMGIDSAKITDVELNRGEARITVRYRADISAVTRDSDGKLIAGSMSDAAQTDDLWTFRRQIGSGDPNWLLDEAESA